jgi:hypothetical protein
MSEFKIIFEPPKRDFVLLKKLKLSDLKNLVHWHTCLSRLIVFFPIFGLIFYKIQDE